MLDENVFRKINQSAVQFLLPLSIEDTYKTVVKEAIRILDGKYGSVFLKNGARVEKVYSSSPELAKLKPRKNGNIFRALHRRSPFCVPLPKLYRPPAIIGQLGIKSLILIPLYYQRKNIGVLTVSTTKQVVWLKKDTVACRLLGAMATLAIRKAQLYTKNTEAMQVRDNFLSMTAHELKTPLTSINGYIQLLEKRMEKGNAEQEKNWLKSLRSESARLTRMVDELLLLNRIHAGKLEYSFGEYSLAKLTQKVTEEASKLYPTHHYIFENQVAAASDKIICDKQKLEQVIFNILENAAKFSPFLSQVHVTLKNIRRQLILTVSDSGQGISAKSLAKIFTEFQKENSENVLEGMGVGLYMSKKIIDRHHGEIRVESVKGKGTAVTIMLPQLIAA